MFERIGDVLPRFDLYVRLFPDQGQLLAAMVRVYGDVVEFCLHARKVFKKELLPQKFSCESLIPFNTLLEEIYLLVSRRKSMLKMSSPYSYKRQSCLEGLLEELR